MKQNWQQKIILLFIASIALFATGLSCGGGGNPEQPAVTLKFWKPFDSSDKWQPIIAAYQEARPGVAVEYSQKNPETYTEDLLQAMAAGLGPDVFSVRNDSLPRFRDKIQPAPVELMSIREYRESFIDVTASDFIEDNKIYAIPAAVDILALFYNRDMLSSAGLARPPATWPELTNAISKLTQTQSGQIKKSAIALG